MIVWALGKHRNYKKEFKVAFHYTVFMEFFPT